MRTIFLANCLIALLLSILEFDTNIAHWFRHAADNFIFSQSIGLSIYAIFRFSGIESITNRLLRLCAVLASFLVGGWIGLLIGLGLNSWLFGFAISSGYFKAFFIRISLFTVFVATVVYSFMLLRERLQRTADALAAKEVNEQRLLRLKTRAELEALRSRVNPHFLFNTLNTIASLIPANPVKAEDMLQKLSHLFRYTLDCGDNTLIELSEELQVVRDYLEIEKVRMGRRLDYEIDVDGLSNTVQIPGLLLQPLVENSVKHGIAPSERGGTVRIQCRADGKTCAIVIEDDGLGFEAETYIEGFGLGALKERLSLTYGENYSLAIENQGGVSIRISIPMITGGESQLDAATVSGVAR